MMNEGHPSENRHTSATPNQRAKAETQCAVCATLSPQPVRLQSVGSGSPDLDTRPARDVVGPEMLASWMQVCPRCGYCNTDLAMPLPGAPKVIESAAYRAQLADTTLCLPAARYLCSALIYEAARSHARAAWYALHAAWVCDDAADMPGAICCRERAATRFAQAEQAGLHIARSPEMAQVVLIDVLRRAQDFAAADQRARAAADRCVERRIRSLIRFETFLIAQGDAGCYTVAQALGNF
jgi:hypothetical protein